MYNRYISSQEAHVSVDHGHHAPGPERPHSGGVGGLLAGILGRGGGEGKQAGQALSSLLKTLHLEHLDAGDILLGLIVLFLVLEDGDDLDLLITLGLTILLSLGEP